MPVGSGGITAIYAALLALWWVVLAARVIGARRAARVSLGDGGDAELLRRIRVHGNASESIPILIVLLLLVELAGLPGWLVHLLGLASVAGRVLHAVHFWRPRESATLRVAGMLLTFFPIVIGALTLLGHALGHALGGAV